MYTREVIHYYTSVLTTRAGHYTISYYDTMFSCKQDYRVPPMMPPTDIVESVDMDLSEDEDQRKLYIYTIQHTYIHKLTLS